MTQLHRPLSQTGTTPSRQAAAAWRVLRDQLRGAAVCRGAGPRRAEASVVFTATHSEAWSEHIYDSKRRGLECLQY